MNLNELAKEIHQNAVAHGWWESNRSTEELIALIHSEWSEALEEARAGRPNVWYACYGPGADARKICADTPQKAACPQYIPKDRGKHCQNANPKPEGVAVELIDGCIRILDLFGHDRSEMVEDDLKTPTELSGLYVDGDKTAKIPKDAATLVFWLHQFTADAVKNGKFDPVPLFSALALAVSWVHREGIDPLALMLEKHAYNKHRPYKHGKQF